MNDEMDIGVTNTGDPVHEASAPTTYWTTANVEEAMPGVLTPLTWTFWRDAVNMSVARGYHRLGFYSRGRVARTEQAEFRLTASFFGRAAANVDIIREMGDLTPGSTGDAAEARVFGTAREGMPPASTNRRLLFFMAGHAHELVFMPRRLRAFARDQRAWWAAMTQPAVVGSPGAAVRLRDAQARFDAALVEHTSSTMLSFVMFGLLSRLAMEAGEPGLEAELATGYGGLEEAAMLADLWAVSRDELHLRGFIARHGFHGPEEGQLHTVSWREDPSPVETLLEQYRGLPESESPYVVAKAQAASRADAEARLLSGLAKKRRLASLVLRLGRAYIPLREVGKAAFLMAIDVARSAAHDRGDELVAEGKLDDPADVRFLTVAELSGAAPSSDLRRLIAERRARHEHYQRQVLPQFWVGEPTPIPLGCEGSSNASRTRLEGVVVVPGVVEARARIALDATAALKIQPGEVLVCRTTDPSWTPVFGLAGALVIDIGGPMSHGAIVARELGIPCIIATGRATQIVSDGALVRVDAGRGVVEVLEP